MNTSHKKLLKKNYENACNEYLKAFCSTYELQYEEDAWVAGDVGTIALIGDYYIDFQDMKYMLDNAIAFENWLRWYDYCLELNDLGLFTPNFGAWCRGYKGLTKEQIQGIKDKRQELKELIDSYNKNQNAF